MVIHESFLCKNLGAWHPLVRQKQTIRKGFSAKIILFTDSRKFSPSKVSRYTVADNSQMRLGACAHIQTSVLHNVYAMNGSFKGSLVTKMVCDHEPAK